MVSPSGAKRRHRTTRAIEGRVRWGFDAEGPPPVDVDPAGHGLIEPFAELRTISTRGGEIVVQLAGPEAGFPMVILHGWGRCSWSRDLQYLYAPLLELGYRIIAPDYPGFGRTRGRRWCARSETNYEDGGPVQILEDILESLSLHDAKIDIIGWSWGGGIACSFVLRHQVRLRNLVLWQGSYTDKDNELRKVKVPTLIVWVPVDQVHPVSLGRHFKEEFPNNQMIELKVGAFKPEKCRHCYEACTDKVVPAIIDWLRTHQTR